MNRILLSSMLLLSLGGCAVPPPPPNTVFQYSPLANLVGSTFHTPAYEAAVKAQEDAQQQAAKEEQQRAQEAQDRAEMQSILENRRLNAAYNQRVAQARAQEGIREYEAKLGYSEKTIEDFLIDGKTLSSNDAKVAITGDFVSIGGNYYLFPSSMSALFAFNNGNTSLAVPVLIDNASEATRKYLFGCMQTAQGVGGAPVIPCGGTYLGEASTCAQTSLFGEKSIPCLEIQHFLGVDTTHNTIAGG